MSFSAHIPHQSGNTYDTSMYFLQSEANIVIDRPSCSEIKGAIDRKCCSRKVYRKFQFNWKQCI